VNIQQRLPLALLFLRLGVFIVMLMWTLAKFIKPEQTAGIFKRYYFFSDISQPVIFTVAALQLLVVLAFVVGFKKRWSYGIVLVLHGISTLASFDRYLGFSHLLFFAAWPMLAASFALYYLRDADTLLVLDRPDRTRR
jgi:putative oxidoreductase